MIRRFIVTMPFFWWSSTKQNSMSFALTIILTTNDYWWSYGQHWIFSFGWLQEKKLHNIIVPNNCRDNKKNYIDAYTLWTVTQLKMITMWIIIKSLERNNNFSLHQSNHSILYVRMNKNEFTKYNFGRGLHSMGQLGASKTKRKIFT